MTAAPASAFTIQDFGAKWRGASLKERSAAQSHVDDLCRALGVPSPTEADPTGSFYAFERGAEKTGGGQGWADVWFRGHFAWEYKGQRADLRAAYRQLRQYVEDLENPPLRTRRGLPDRPGRGGGCGAARRPRVPHSGTGRGFG